MNSVFDRHGEAWQHAHGNLTGSRTQLEPRAHQVPIPQRDLSDREWEIARSMMPESGPYRGCGRPLADTRAVLNGVLWIMRSGEGWSKLPARYPPYQTCHRRYQRWRNDGSLRQLAERLYGEYGVALYLSLSKRSRQRASGARAPE
ncbi:transposase [Trinickia mobilis]|uniref:transposase n=1 Tax=Trinickia mobilis TaxID=2816356 RepID=UPI001A905006|nr:transposase [Trinickia mobilis]